MGILGWRHRDTLYNSRKYHFKTFVWKLHAEVANLSGLEHAQALLDLVRAFETVPHRVLVEAAKKKGYPMAILRLSIAAYTLCRAIGIDGVYSWLITATRGFTAGSGFATSELRVLMLDLIRAVQAGWANVILTKVYG